MKQRKFVTAWIAGWLSRGTCLNDESFDVHNEILKWCTPSAFNILKYIHAYSKSRSVTNKCKHKIKSYTSKCSFKKKNYIDNFILLNLVNVLLIV